MASIVNALTQFRRRTWFFTADIKQMFLQTVLCEEDRNFQLVLIRNPSTNEIETWRFTRHIFGNRGSPTATTFTIQNNARQFQDKFPEEVRTDFERLHRRRLYGFLCHIRRTHFKVKKSDANLSKTSL